MRRNRSLVHLLFVLTLACTAIMALGGPPATAGHGGSSPHAWSAA